MRCQAGLCPSSFFSCLCLLEPFREAAAEPQQQGSGVACEGLTEPGLSQHCPPWLCHKGDPGQGWLLQGSHTLPCRGWSLGHPPVFELGMEWVTCTSNSLSLAREQMSVQSGEPRRDPEAAAESTAPARQTVIPSQLPPQPGSSCGRKHTLHLEIHGFLFSFMLHCGFNKDTNMQSKATCPRELRRDRRRWSAGREALGKVAEDTLPARTAPPETTSILSLAHYRPSSPPLPCGAQSVPPLARAEAAARRGRDCLYCKSWWFWPGVFLSQGGRRRIVLLNRLPRVLTGEPCGRGTDAGVPAAKLRWQSAAAALKSQEVKPSNN